MCLASTLTGTAHWLTHYTCAHTYMCSSYVVCVNIHNTSDSMYAFTMPHRVPVQPHSKVYDSNSSELKATQALARKWKVEAAQLWCVSECVHVLCGTETQLAHLQCHWYSTHVYIHRKGAIISLNKRPAKPASLVPWANAQGCTRETLTSASMPSRWNFFSKSDTYSK